MRRRVAFVADTHIDDTKRFDEHNEVMEWITTDALTRGCCAMIHTGDVYERRSTAREREKLFWWVYGVTMRMPLVVVRGNHDDPLDIELLGHLSTGGHRCQVFTRPGWCTPEETGGLWVCCLPWPNKAHLLAGRELSGEEADRQARLALQAILRQWGELGSGYPDAPRIFAGHVMMSGSRTSISQPPLVGMDLELGLEDLALARAAFYALGHIHLGQQWLLDDGAGNGVPVVYPGNPMRRNFGEVEQKGYVVAEFEGPRLVSWDRVLTPCAPMLHLEGEYLPARVDPDTKLAEPASLRVQASPEEINNPETWAGAEVRLRYSVRPEDRAAAAADLKRYVAQVLGRAKLVKVEERVIPTSRARLPEITRAPTLSDKLVAYWNSQGQAKAPPGEQRERLLALLATTEIR